MPGGWHGAYLPVYAMLFAAIRDTENSVLEIGVDGGGSLLMYADHFERASIFGMDISPEPDALKGKQRITFFQRDAYADEAVKLCDKLGPFALIVDDGNHFIASQRVFCASYPRLLARDGIAIIEDVQSIDHFAQLATALSPEFFGFGIDLRMHDGRYDNLLFVIKRR